MSTNKRHGNKWTINEILSLQREYELLEWSVYEIAEKHERTVMAIMSKLQKENFIASWNEARGFNIEEYQEDSCLLQTGNINEEEDDDEEYDYTQDVYDDADDNEKEIENNVRRIMNRLWSLQSSIGEIGSIVKQLFIFAAKPKELQQSESI
jgi:hypothetical protein